jgi:hypothetical protein
MKRITRGVEKMLTVLSMLMLLLAFTPVLMARPIAQNPVPYEHSFRMLDEHGEWIHNARFGRVWRPYVAAGWRPFLYGEWDWADNQWFWDSYEPFGWVVYHYGNWYFQDGSWVWIPGYEYSPARVTWIDFDDYIGWAPLPPAGVAWPEPWVTSSFTCWNIVSVHDFHEHEIDRHIITRTITRPKEIERVVRKAPHLEKIETVTNTKIEKIKTKHVIVPDGKRSIKQAQLPEEHIRRTQPFRDRINKQVLVAKTHKSR